jgi:hypothetical protein
MKTTCPTCQGHGFVYSYEAVSAPPKPKPEETETKPKHPAKGINGNLSHLRKI